MLWNITRKILAKRDLGSLLEEEILSRALKEKSGRGTSMRVFVSPGRRNGLEWDRGAWVTMNPV